MIVHAWWLTRERVSDTARTCPNYVLASTLRERYQREMEEIFPR